MGTGTASIRSCGAFPRAAEEQQRQRQADPGQDDAGRKAD